MKHLLWSKDKFLLNIELSLLLPILVKDVVLVVFYSYYYVGFDQTEHNSNSNDVIICQDYFEKKFSYFCSKYSV